MTWKQIVAGICGFVLGFWACMPRELQLAPRYEALVLDAAGKGLAGVRVEQTRRDFAVTDRVSSSSALADAYGRVAFAAVRARSSPLLRAWVCGRRKTTLGVRAECGYSQEIHVGLEEMSRVETELPLQGRGRLVVIRVR